MEFTKSLAVAAAGLKAQSGRMRIIAENIANADSAPASAGAQPYRRKIPTFTSHLDDETGTIEVGKLGDLVVRALHTPGHRPEHTAFALVDRARGTEPWAVLTGDTLFVGDIARPDLAVDKEEGARGIFRSLGERLLTLPDTTEVWPGHLGGSMCGGPGMDLKISSTIGFERAHQALLRVDDEDAFVRETTAALGPQPPNFRNIVALNQGPLVMEVPDAHPLTPRQVEQAGALLRAFEPVHDVAVLEDLRERSAAVVLADHVLRHTLLAGRALEQEREDVLEGHGKIVDG